MCTISSVCTEACWLMDTRPLVGGSKDPDLWGFSSYFEGNSCLFHLGSHRTGGELWASLSCLWSPEPSPSNAGFLESHPPLIGNAGGYVLWGTKGMLAWASRWPCFSLFSLDMCGILWQELTCFSHGLSSLQACKAPDLLSQWPSAFCWHHLSGVVSSLIFFILYICIFYSLNCFARVLERSGQKHMYLISSV